MPVFTPLCDSFVAVVSFESAVFVLPNPSGRNAHFSYGEMLAAYQALARYIECAPPFL